MNKLFDFLITFIIMGIIIIVYLNIDSITEATKNFFITEKKVIINESNDYKRDYNYISFNYDEDYYPLNSFDIKNIFFNILNNGWNEFTFYCPSEYENCIDDVKKIANDKVLVSEINGYVSPYNSFKNINTRISSSGEIYVEVIKNYSDSVISDVTIKINEIYTKLNVDKERNISEKIHIIQNYIIDNVEYDENMADNGNSEYFSNTAYGALFQGYGVCTGYSDTMALFLDKMNIPNIKISSENHVWNLVLVDNEWKHLDLTWNDTKDKKYTNNYFLIDNETLFERDQDEHNYNKDFYKEALNN